RPRFVRRRQTALLVPVPEADVTVDHWRRQHDPTAVAGVPAHVTVLYPFAPPAALRPVALEDLRAIAAHTPSFAFELRSVGRFPGVVHLAPEPAEPFVALTESLVDRWPQHQPYEGRYDEVVPHLTVAEGLDERLGDELARAM